MSKEDFHSYKELLTPDKMILMYSSGAFPMADETGEINWYMPDVRTVIPLDSLHIPRSLKKFLLSANFEFRYDYNPIEVIKQCAQRESTWISDELIEAYKRLNSLGYIHSVEVFLKNILVGGLYGIGYLGAFFGESMFSKVPQASKCALAKLLERLREKEFVLLDVQYQTEHLKMFGAREIPFDEFSNMLLISRTKNISFL